MTGHNFSRRGVVALVMASLAGPAAGDVPSLASHGPPAVQIVEKGVFEAETVASASKATATGVQNWVRNPRLVRSTAIVPGQIGVRFGLRYVAGASKEASVDLKLVIRFPDPGLHDPKTGTRYFRSEQSLVVQAGAAGYWEYHLESDWEIVPGVWEFEFWSGERRLAVERFCVIDAAARPEPEGILNCSQLLTRSYKHDNSRSRAMAMHAKRARPAYRTAMNAACLTSPLQTSVPPQNTRTNERADECNLKHRERVEDSDENQRIIVAVKCVAHCGNGS